MSKIFGVMSEVCHVTGLLPCPKCGKKPRAKTSSGAPDGPNFQTPAEDDGMVRRVYVRCFGCGHIGPTRTIPPIHWTKSGTMPIAPDRDAWNQHVREESGE